MNSKRKLNSIKILNEDTSNWPVIINSLGQALNEMRVNYEQEIQLKNMNEVTNKNPLLRKRLTKKNQVKEIETNEHVKVAIVDAAIPSAPPPPPPPPPQLHPRHLNERSLSTALYYSVNLMNATKQ